MPDDTLDIVDPHQHFWDLERNYVAWLTDKPRPHFRYGDYSAIKKTYLPPDYRRDAGSNRVVKTVHIEAWRSGDPLEETRWLEQVHAEHGLPSAIVGEAALAADNVGEILAGHAKSKLARGVRSYPASAANPREARRGAPGSMDDPKWRSGLALLAQHNFSLDLQSPWWHLDAAADVASDFPQQQIVLSHCGLPADPSADALAAWRRALEHLARQPNVAVKVSGICFPGEPWSLAVYGPVIRDTIAIFGPDRAMFASNFPVDRLVGSFTTIYDGFRTLVAERPLAERKALFHDNAVRIYRL
jgi:predicted TIM-barrel fold metal-dependent hydrolase